MLRNHQIIATLTLCCCTGLTLISRGNICSSYKLWQAGLFLWEREPRVENRQRQITNSTSAKWTTLINFGPCIRPAKGAAKFSIKINNVAKNKATSTTRSAITPTTSQRACKKKSVTQLETLISCVICFVDH